MGNTSSNDLNLGSVSLGKGDSVNPQAMNSFDQSGAGLQVAAKLGELGDSESARGRLASGDPDSEFGRAESGDDNARLPDDDDDGDQSACSCFLVLARPLEQEPL